MKTRIISGLSAIIIGSTVFAGCGSSEKPVSASRGGAGGALDLPAKDVQLVSAEMRKMQHAVTATGTLAADEQATLSFKVPGRVKKLLVDLGSQVKKGQAIAMLETTDYEGRLRGAEAAMQQARVRLGLPPQGDDDKIDIEKTSLIRQNTALLEESRQNLERTRRLFKEGIQTKAELDRLESAYKVAESRYQDALEEIRNRQAVLLQRRSELFAAKQQLIETTIYAPFDGAVRERTATMGEYLTAGGPVLSIVRVHPLRLKVEVPEREAQGIRTGQVVRVFVEGEGDIPFSGRVARISPAFQEQSRSLVLEAEVENRGSRLRPGSFAKAEIQSSSSNDVVVIPTSAVVSFAGIQKIFSVKDGKAQEKNIFTGKRDGDWIVAQGIDAGTKVVISPGNLTAGQKVKIKN